MTSAPDPSHHDLSRLVDALEQAAEARSADAVVRAVEASAARSAARAQRARTKAQLMQVRAELAAQKHQRRTGLRRSREDTRAMLDDIRNDVDMLRVQVRDEQTATREALAQISHDRRQRLEEVRYVMAVQAAARRQRTAALLDRFAEQRHLTAAKQDDHLASYRDGLRQAVGSALGGHRALRRWWRQGWSRRRTLPAGVAVEVGPPPPSTRSRLAAPSVADLVALPTAIAESASPAHRDGPESDDAVVQAAPATEWLATAAARTFADLARSAVVGPAGSRCIAPTATAGPSAGEPAHARQ